MDNASSELPSWDETTPVEAPSEPGVSAAPSPTPDASSEPLPKWEDTFDPQEKYGTLGQQTIAGLEGAAQGLAGPLAPVAERALGVNPEDIRGRQEANPWTHGIAEGATFAGSMLTGVGEGALIAKAGDALFHGFEAANTAQKMALGAAKAATEMGIYGASDEGTKAILQDPSQSVGSALANVGASAVLGGAFGAGTSALGSAAKAGFNKLAGNEFIDRLSARYAGLNPAEAAEKEFTEGIQAYHAMNDELTGPSGMKAQALEKLMPEEVTPGIQAHMQSLTEKAAEAHQEMLAKQVPERLVNKFTMAYDQLAEVMNKPGSTPGEIFDAMNDFKKDLQSYSKGNWGPNAVAPHSEAYDFINIAKGLGHEVRTGLEDPKSWGKVADLQKKVNASWTKILPTIKDVQGKFMSKVEGQYVPDATKFNTYMNQNGKATSQTIRQKMMGNFVDSMEKHHAAVDQAYRDAGVVNPHEMPGMSALKESLEKPSIGSKLADWWYDKASPEALGAGVGAAAAHSVIPGSGFVGAYLGKDLLSPVFGAIIKPLMEKGMNSEALNSTLAYTKSVQKGNSLVEKAMKGLFIPGGSQLVREPSQKDLEKLDNHAKDLGENVDKMADLSSRVSEMLPDHGIEMSKAIGTTVQHLNTQRPSTDPGMPLNSPKVVSKMQQAQYNRTLAIAQQPLMVMNHIKDGTLTAKDVQTMSTLHPGMYQKLSTGLAQQIAQAQADGHNISYHMRMSLSKFLGHPLDSTMQPMAIQAAQPMQQQGGGSKKPSAKASTSMNKEAKEHQTQSQAAESDRAGRD